MQIVLHVWISRIEPSFNRGYNIVMKISLFKIVFALVFFLSPFGPAGMEHNLSGYAWSSTIGWISFKNINTGGV